MLFSQTIFLKAQNVDISGFARNYSGVMYQTGDFSILQNTLNLDLSKKGDRIAFKANPLLYHYWSDSLNLQLRELYLDMNFKNFDLRVGKQQVVWGKAEGVFITDVVSPLNLSEFLLPDFDEIRLGVNAVKLNYYIGNHTFEAIWLASFTPSRKPNENSIWFVKPEFPVPATFDWSNSDVNPSLENSELFIKYSAMTSKIDFEIMSGYTWDDNPTMHTRKILDMSSGQPVLTGLNITPEHHRLYLAGGSFSTEIKGIIFRGEAAYYHSKFFQTQEPTAIDGLTQKNYLQYVAGIDFNIGNTKFSTQFIQKYIFDHNDLMLTKEFDNMATFLARHDFFRETLHVELFSYIGLTGKDALIRPKITYDFENSFSILGGANIFVGDKTGQFGQFNENSMLYLKMKYSF